MGSAADKLSYALGTKDLIRDAIEGMGVSVPLATPFRQYPDYIRMIGGGGGGNDIIELRTQAKTAVPDSVEVVVKADDNYDALSKVIIEAAAVLQPQYIRKGVTMFGVTGTMKVEE